MVSDKLVKDATNDCLRSGYTRCTQLGASEFELVPKEVNHGKWGCQVQVVIRGQ
jgi:hypothetical protein